MGSRKPSVTGTAQIRKPPAARQPRRAEVDEVAQPARQPVEVEDGVRLDAVGYVVKKRGTSCFMVEPEIYDTLDWLVARAAEHGLLVLPEIHDVPATHRKLSARGYWPSDFVLPGLLLVGLFMVWSIYSTWRSGDASVVMGRVSCTWRERFELLPRVVPCIVIILGVLYALDGGIATPSETAAVGAMSRGYEIFWK